MTTATNPVGYAFHEKLNDVYDTNLTYETGRKYDKVFNQSHRFFIDRATGDIYGAKSEAQVNFRRWYGRLNTIDEWDWNTLTPLAGSVSEALLQEREAKIQSTYKQRGRPRKIPNTGTLPIIP